MRLFKHRWQFWMRELPFQVSWEIFRFRNIYRGCQILETIERTCILKKGSITHFRQYQSFKGSKNGHEHERNIKWRLEIVEDQTKIQKSQKWTRMDKYWRGYNGLPFGKQPQKKKTVARLFQVYLFFVESVGNYISPSRGCDFYS